tara:strand:+ start:401 stop:772 length:372 start_codon:yes stop_codon:yes gene_type:complete
MKKKMSEDTQTMIQQALDQDWNKANKTFSDMMSVKLQDVLDQEKVKLADQIYNGTQEIEDEDIDDDQLEMDLEDEGDDGEEGEEGELPLEDAEEGIQEPSDNVELEVGDEDGEGEEDPSPEES